MRPNNTCQKLLNRESVNVLYLFFFIILVSFIYLILRFRWVVINEKNAYDYLGLFLLVTQADQMSFKLNKK